jgi:hypothetical protein
MPLPANLYPAGPARPARQEPPRPPTPPPQPAAGRSTAGPPLRLGMPSAAGSTPPLQRLRASCSCLCACRPAHLRQQRGACGSCSGCGLLRAGSCGKRSADPVRCRGLHSPSRQRMVCGAPGCTTSTTNASSAARLGAGDRWRCGGGAASRCACAPRRPAPPSASPSSLSARRLRRCLNGSASAMLPSRAGARAKAQQVRPGYRPPPPQVPPVHVVHRQRQHGH